MLTSVSTLAHELGHYSMHRTESRKIPAAHLCALRLAPLPRWPQLQPGDGARHLPKSNNDPQFQISVMTRWTANFHRYSLSCRFWPALSSTYTPCIEQGQALTADYMNKLLADMYREGYGPEVDVDEQRVGEYLGPVLDPYVSQFIMSTSTQQASQQPMRSHSVINGGPQAAEDYKNFLKAEARFSRSTPLPRSQWRRHDHPRARVEKAFNVFERAS